MLDRGTHAIGSVRTLNHMRHHQPSRLVVTRRPADTTWLQSWTNIMRSRSLFAPLGILRSATHRQASFHRGQHHTMHARTRRRSRDDAPHTSTHCKLPPPIPSPHPILKHRARDETRTAHVQPSKHLKHLREGRGFSAHNEIQDPVSTILVLRN